MKRTTTTKSDESNTLKEFLKDFSIKMNDGIHSDLKTSAEYLEKNGLEDYIVDGNGLDVTAVEQNEDLTVEQVLEIGMHFARWGVHENLHRAMESSAKKHGLGDELAKIKSDDSLPEEVKKVITEALEILMEVKKGKK